MYRNILRGLILTWIFCAFGFSARANEALELIGTVKSIKKVAEGNQSVQINVELYFTLKNTSSNDILLYRSNFDEINLLIFKRDGEPTGHLVYRVGGKKSRNSEERVRIRNGLDCESPPAELIALLRHGEELNFGKKVGLVFFKSRVSSSPNETWDSIVKSAPTWLTIEVETIPDLTDGLMAESGSLTKELQKRWLKHGVLWVDTIVSRPIPIDFSIVSAM